MISAESSGDFGSAAASILGFGNRERIDGTRGFLRVRFWALRWRYWPHAQARRTGRSVASADALVRRERGHVKNGY